MITSNRRRRKTQHPGRNSTQINEKITTGHPVPIGRLAEPVPKRRRRRIYFELATFRPIDTGRHRRPVQRRRDPPAGPEIVDMRRMHPEIGGYIRHRPIGIYQKRRQRYFLLMGTIITHHQPPRRSHAPEPATDAPYTPDRNRRAGGRRPKPDPATAAPGAAIGNDRDHFGLQTPAIATADHQ